MVTLKSDSLAALRAFRKGASASRGLNLSLRELALLEACDAGDFIALEHIPGVSNVLPGALSRLWAPEAKQFPGALQSIAGERVPVRGKTYWVTLCPPAPTQLQSAPAPAGPPPSQQ